MNFKISDLMGNLITNVYAQSNYDRLRINKALGFWKYENKNKNKKSINNVYSHWGQFQSKNILLWITPVTGKLTKKLPTKSLTNFLLD